jgi:hypothetical protein
VFRQARHLDYEGLSEKAQRIMEVKHAYTYHYKRMRIAPLYFFGLAFTIQVKYNKVGDAPRAPKPASLAYLTLI